MTELFLVVWVTTATFIGGNVVEESQHFAIFDNEDAAVECVIGKSGARIFEAEERKLTTVAVHPPQSKKWICVNDNVELVREGDKWKCPASGVVSHICQDGRPGLALKGGCQ